MKVNAIYSTFSGEVNPYGIGAPTIFLRLQGCPIRCYKRTMGILCDTPEALKKPTDEDFLVDIVNEVVAERDRTGISFVTFSGGDPLWNDETSLQVLMKELLRLKFKITVETSGTISWLPYLYEGVNMILDYKVKSAGIKNGTELFYDKKHLSALRKDDFIKFVIHDLEDYEEFEDTVDYLLEYSEATIAVGCFWGGEIDTFGIFELLKKDRLLGKVTLNMQAHKMAISSNYKIEIPQKI